MLGGASSSRLLPIKFACKKNEATQKAASFVMIISVLLNNQAANAVGFLADGIENLIIDFNFGFGGKCGFAIGFGFNFGFRRCGLNLVVSGLQVDEPVIYGAHAGQSFVVVEQFDKNCQRQPLVNHEVDESRIVG